MRAVAGLSVPALQLYRSTDVLDREKLMFHRLMAVYTTTARAAHVHTFATGTGVAVHASKYFRRIAHFTSGIRHSGEIVGNGIFQFLQHFHVAPILRSHYCFLLEIERTAMSLPRARQTVV